MPTATLEAVAASLAFKLMLRNVTFVFGEQTAEISLWQIETEK